MHPGLDGVVGADVLRDHEQLELLHRLAHAICVRQRHGQIGADHPQRLDLATRDRLEHLHRLSPSWVAMRGAFQKRRTRSMSGGEKPICAASWLARPPTSRPPIALGWPVSENGDAPILPMRPVARWQFRIALTLSVPCADWLTPCE